MRREQFETFDCLRSAFRNYAAGLSAKSPWLGELQEELRVELGYEDYKVETPIVYNRALDDLGPGDEPAFIIVADNPGKNEQKKTQNRYLVGQSGKLAKGWFASELKLDFYKACVIINKTPIHTPKTAEIALLKRLARRKSARLGDELDAILDQSQRWMARLAFDLHSCLGCVLWVSGYGELRPGKLFRPWGEETAKLYAAAPSSLRDKVWVFRHFSMNQFSIEYARSKTGDSTLQRLAAIGTTRRKEILGW
ncbi:MAG: hypothetical protein NT061_10995 [Spirochaetes bacterium]|nr:hypothetical protein [Spirochaetota bacterium]